MSAILIFLGVIGIISGIWLSRQRLLSKPWLEAGMTGHETDLPSRPIVELGLAVFLVVIGALFALLTSAYFMRMAMGDWQPLPIPRLLWLNTGVLIGSSIALEAASAATRHGDAQAMRRRLVIAALLALLFLAGQLLAWRALAMGGYLPAGNPANAFFYLLTGLHGLHLSGGLVALLLVGRATILKPSDPRTHRTIRLCAVYWHFLLLLWLALFVLLNLSTGAPGPWLHMH